MANGLPDGYVYTGSGTGTELDPYIPSDCKEFMYAVLQDGVYVKLESIIDFSTDSDYKLGISDTLSIGCAKIYADAPSGNTVTCGINGLVIRHNNFFTFTSSAATLIDSICITNCMWVQQSNSSQFISFGSYVRTFQDCVMSFLINFDGKSNAFEVSTTNNVSYIRCSQYFQFTNNKSSSGYSRIFVYHREYCTVELNSLPLALSASSGQYSWYVIENATMTTFFGDIHCATTSGYKNFRFNNMNHCCIALQVSNSSTDQIAVSGSNITTTIINKDLLPLSTGIDQLISISDAEMKSEPYLLSIGFVP